MQRHEQLSDNTGQDDRVKLVAICGFVTGLCFVSLAADTAVGSDQIYPLSILSLILAGFTILGLHRVAARVQGHQPSSYRAGLYNSVSFPERLLPRAADNLDGKRRIIGRLYVFTIAAVVWQVEIIRRIRRDSQCSGVGLEAFVPVLVALNSWRNSQQQNRRHCNEGTANFRDGVPKAPGASRLQCLLSSLLVSWGAYMALLKNAGAPSTYICAGNEPANFGNSVLLLQIASLVGKSAIVCCVAELLRDKFQDGRRKERVNKFYDVGWIFIISAVLLSLVVLVLSASGPNFSSRALNFGATHLWTLAGEVFLVACTMVFAVQLLHEIGALGVSIIATVIFACLPGLKSALTDSLHFLPTARLTVFFSMSLMLAGSALFFGIKLPSGTPLFTTNITENKLQRRHALLGSFLMALLFVRVFVDLSSTGTVRSHPIDVLMEDAKQQHQDWLKNASASHSLSGAVGEYRTRYDRHPPPGFDIWYDFATARRAAILDDYDTIHNDLLPFWSLSPQELRRRTWQLRTDPDNDIAVIVIRNGKIMLPVNSGHPYYQSLKDVADMINEFARWLPDMDLAINLNNDCRVTVPWLEIEKYREIGRKAGSLQWGKDVRWSLDRAKGWDEQPGEDSSHPNHFQKLSPKGIFHTHGIVGCPLDSASATDLISNKHEICLSCIQPHSLGAFLSNWTLAGDVCHQPDMADLHGQYTLPWRFKGSYHLLPIFSQRKLHGFNDILYPGARLYEGTEEHATNYSPTSEYPDPPFDEKNNSVFWRGQPFEGVSISGKWRGMTPQRLVDLANGRSPNSRAIVLTESGNGRYKYQEVSYAKLHSSLSLDVSIDRNVTQCDRRDHEDQMRLLKVSTSRIPFQQRWQFRYLIDIDDGLFGHFLPYLRSRSLPFRASLFREWYDSRLTAWLHFVPLDGRLHGFYSTLAYFAGLNATDTKGHMVRMADHTRNGEYIARTGREWAEKALREEDKLIYFFRLCLEWGRLTDDRRDDIGFQM